jgi:hypothetical protein
MSFDSINLLEKKFSNLQKELNINIINMQNKRDKGEIITENMKKKRKNLLSKMSNLSKKINQMKKSKEANNNMNLNNLNKIYNLKIKELKKLQEIQKQNFSSDKPLNNEKTNIAISLLSNINRTEKEIKEIEIAKQEYIQFKINELLAEKDIIEKLIVKQEHLKELQQTEHGYMQELQNKGHTNLNKLEKTAQLIKKQENNIEINKKIYNIKYNLNKLPEKLRNITNSIKILTNKSGTVGTKRNIETKKKFGIVNPYNACYIIASLQLLNCINEFKNTLNNTSNNNLLITLKTVLNKLNEGTISKENFRKAYTELQKVLPNDHIENSQESDFDFLYNIFDKIPLPFIQIKITTTSFFKNQSRAPVKDEATDSILRLNLGYNNISECLENHFKRKNEVNEVNYANSVLKASQISIEIPPENRYLIINLLYNRRINGRININNPTLLNEIINIGDKHYLLKGAIFHKGNTPISGHYIFYKYNYDKNNITIFDDSHVLESEKDGNGYSTLVINTINKNEDYTKFYPTTLLYERIQI